MFTLFCVIPPSKKAILVSARTHVDAIARASMSHVRDFIPEDPSSIQDDAEIMVFEVVKPQFWKSANGPGLKPEDLTRVD